MCALSQEHTTLPSGYPSDFALLHPRYLWEVATQLLASYSGNARVALPDPRGVNQSSRPASPDLYEYWTLVEDQRAVAAAVFGNGTAFHVVGCDFGGVVAWGLASRFPSVVASLQVINAPHPLVLSDLIDRSEATRYRSKFVRALLEPSFVETACAADDDAGCGGLVAALFPQTDPSDSAALAAMSNVWRANCKTAAFDHPRFSCRFGGMANPVGAVTPPTAVLWATSDPFYANDEILARIPALVRDLRHLERVELEGHDRAVEDACFVAQKASPSKHATCPRACGLLTLCLLRHLYTGATPRARGGRRRFRPACDRARAAAEAHAGRRRRSARGLRRRRAPGHLRAGGVERLGGLGRALRGRWVLLGCGLLC